MHNEMKKKKKQNRQSGNERGFFSLRQKKKTKTRVKWLISIHRTIVAMASALDEKYDQFFSSKTSFISWICVIICCVMHRLIG